MSSKKKKLDSEKRKKIRQGHRTYTQKLVENVADTVGKYNETPESSLESKLKQLRITLLERLDILKDLDEKILEDFDEDEEILDEIERAGKFREFVHEAVVKIDAILSPAKNEESKKNSSTVNASTSGPSGGKSTKLPKLVLQKYQGEPTKWQSFWDSFKSAVHDNQHLTEIDKFNYLKSLLHGSAAQTISGLALTATNYETAVNLLEKRFGNKQLIVSGHMDSLLKISALSSSKDVEKLRQTYDQIEAHVRGLQALDVPISSYGSLLVPVLLSKIPDDIGLLISRQIKEESWDFGKLLSLLREEVENRERCCGMQALASNDQSETKSKLNQKPERKPDNPATASALHAAEGKAQPSCTYCKQQHTSTNCHVVTNRAARQDILRKQGRCFICLRKNHLARDCESKGSCFKCSRRHHVSLCDNLSRIPPVPESAAKTNTLQVSSQDNILLQTAQAFVGVENPRSGVRVRLIFDSGSQRSYITQRIRSQLKLETTRKESLMIKTFGNNHNADTVRICEKVQVAIGDVLGSNFSTLIEAYVVPEICSPLEHQEINRAQANFEHLRVQLADENDDRSMEIDLLIGADNMWRFFTGKSKRGEQDNAPVASETTLGWVLSGPVPSDKHNLLSSVNFVSTHVLKATVEMDQNDILEREMVSKLWDLESVGIRERDSVHESFLKNVSFENNRYNVKLPIKENHKLLPDNYELSLSRLNSLVKRLQKEPDIFREYNQIIKEQLESGIIERVSNSDRDEPGNIHYLPHQAVIRNDALTTKLRIVFDASAKTRLDSPSLNDCMYTGPALSHTILDTLMRFRAHKIGLVGDIEKAFLNIHVDENQRDLMRFLWVDDITKSDPNIETYRFTRVTFGMNSSPFLLNATLQHHILQHYEHDQNFAERLLAGFYVDDFSSGGKEETEAFFMYQEVKSCLTLGGFNMRKWASNSDKLMDMITKEETVNEQNTSPEDVCREDESFAKISVGGLDEVDNLKGEHKVLGMNWNLNEDVFSLKLDKIADYALDFEPTKRNLLRISAKLFDPLGIVAPILVPMRVFFQELCAAKYDWDNTIPEKKYRIVQKWLTDLRNVSQITLNRYYFPGLKQDMKCVSLHAFGDASQKAYCSVVYICIETDSELSVSLVASKTRLAPLSKLTIPRLELLAAVITARLVTAVREALSSVIVIDRLYCWSDSKAVLYWIKSNREYKQFVQNRVKEILELTNSDIWEHCPGFQNPADVGSRGCLASELVNNKIWWNGPAWLKEPPEFYPKLVSSTCEEDLHEDCVKEFRTKPNKGESTSVLLSTTEKKTVPNLSKIVSAERYSTFKKLVRVTAFVLRFISNIKKKQENSELLRNILTREEIDVATRMWILEEQRELKSQTNYQNLEQQFGLYQDEYGILRCRGRLAHAPLPVESRYPIILPRGHYVSKLLVELCHKNVNHGGLKDTLTELRSHYWIPKGRQLVRKILFHCVKCRRLQGTPFKPPGHSDIPEGRLKETTAFTHIGVDHAGPLFVKQPGSSDDGMQKVYICLFTCASSRALHLELAPDLSTEAFIRCLRRMIARRGIPSTITSDNSKTFKSAKKELSNLYKHQEVCDFVANRGIKWDFILEKAPWWGGFYERMVQLVKRTLRKILGNARLTYEELMTVLVEVEGTLNSRPLTYVYSDVCEQPLTPSHLVIGKRLATLPDSSDLSDEEDDAHTLQKRARYLERLLKHFWNRWLKEYLVNLRESHRSKCKKGQTRDISIGDIVIIHDENIARSKWRTGEVKELIKSNDSEVRGAVVRTLTKRGTRSTLRRPVQKLFPLELNTGAVEHKQQPDPIEQPCATCDDMVTLERPKRAAATRAAATIRDLVIDQAV